MSDASSESEEEMMEEANSKGVDQDEGLSKMLDSDESDEDEVLHIFYICSTSKYLCWKGRNLGTSELSKLDIFPLVMSQKFYLFII